MRTALILIFTVFLAACQTTVNAPGPASPQLGEMIGQIVANSNAENGRTFGPDIIGRGATSEGNTVTFVFEVRPDLAADFRNVPRGEVDAFLRTRFRQTFCNDAESRVFIDAGGRAQLSFVDDLGRSLSRFTVSSC